LHPPRALTRCHSFPPAAVAGDPFTTKTFRANLRAPEAPGNPFPGNEIAGASEGDKEGKRFRDARILRQTQKKTVLSKKTEEEKRPEGKEQPEPGGESQPVIIWRYLQDRIRGTHEVLSLPERMRQVAQET
jgi:hypothetical protein